MKFILHIAFFFINTSCFAMAVSTNLTAVYDQQKKQVKLKWQNIDARVVAFVLQRSADNNRWADLCKIEAADFSNTKIEKYTDQHPDPAKNYYRLKAILDNNKAEWSASIMVVMGQSTNSWIIYPVPVTTVLNLQYTGSETITGVISVFVQNTQGRIFNRLRTSSLNRNIQMPVANLGKGIYDVRIMINDEIVWNQRFVK
jgi:hypothetical protein